MNNTTNTTTRTKHTVILPVTLNDETRDIEFTYFEGDKRATGYGFAARVGAGSKLHGASATAYLRDGEWKVSFDACVLNRQGTIVAFTDQVGEQAKSKHRSSSIR